MLAHLNGVLVLRVVVPANCDGVGWGVTKLLYQKSASPAPAQF